MDGTFFLFIIRGGPAWLDNKERPTPFSTTTTKQTLRLFKHGVRLIAKSFLHSCEAALFSPPPFPNARLKGMGFVNIMPRVRLAPLVSDFEQQQISHALLACRLKLTTHIKGALAAGALQLSPSTFRVARHFNIWHEHLTIRDVLAPRLPWDPLCHDARPLPRHCAHEVRNAIAFFETFELICPVCGRSRQPGLFKPRTNHTWQNLRCTNCNLTYPTNR